MENSLGKCFVLLGRSEFPTACPVLMAWKSLWITPYAVLGALRPPEEKKARLRLTDTPPLSWIEIVLLSFVVVCVLARLALGGSSEPGRGRAVPRIGAGADAGTASAVQLGELIWT